ncbi:MAG: CBS domain-containing protein [Bacillota bacterium]
MTTNLITVTPQDTLTQIINQLIDHQLEYLPVVDNKQQLLGLITKNDIIQAYQANS